MIPLAVLHELKLLLLGLPVLRRRIVSALAFGARKSDDLNDLLLSSHGPTLPED